MSEGKRQDFELGINQQINEANFEHKEKREDYPEVPMDAHEQEIREMIRENSSAVIVGETGSGKTTRIPEFLMREFPQSRIAITQPRRVAARSVSRFVAERRGQKIGGEVGYQVRFDDQTTEGTMANFMTDGILLRKLQFDPLLDEFDVVMVDEAHERNLNIDFVLGLLKNVQNERKKQGKKELKIVVTSATIEKKKFADYFGDSPTLEVKGRMFPVDVLYEPAKVFNYQKAAAQKVRDIVVSNDPGDVLIFMPGEDEIRATIKAIEELDIHGVEAMPLYGAMAPEDQDRIFLKNKKRKVIVSTNIAETSVTIDGVCHVIDSGLIKQKEFDPVSGIESLVVKQHAKSGCDQRKGRAGRTASGKCHRLFTEQEFEERDKYQKPEILRSDLAHVVLSMKKNGIEDVRNFDFIDKPDQETFSHAIDTLKMLGALDEQEKITELGDIMSELPLKPELARMVIEAGRFGCVGSVCTIASMMGTSKPVFSRPREKESEADNAHARFKKSGSDFMTLLEVWDEWQASGYNERWARENYLNARQLSEVREIRSQLMKELAKIEESDRLNKIGIENFSVGDQRGSNDESVQKSVVAGLIQHLMVAYGRYGYAKVLNGGNSDEIFIHPSSSAFHTRPKLMIGAEVVATSKTFARKCQPVKAEWIPEIAPQILKESGRSTYYDTYQDQVIDSISYSLPGMYDSIISKNIEAIDQDVAQEKFASAFAEGKVELPVYKDNLKIIETLRELNRRSGGRFALPDETAWYEEKLSGVKSKKEAEMIEEHLQMEIGDFCPEEKLAEIDKLYPKVVTIKGEAINVIYEYSPTNPEAYYESDRNEKFTAIIDIPKELIPDLQEVDIPQIGENGRPQVVYRFAYNTRFASLEGLKKAFEEERAKNAWLNFKKPENSGKIIIPEPLKPLTSLENLGFGPVVYAQDSTGNDLLAYPGITAQRDYSSGGYRFFVEYYEAKAEAISAGETSKRIKEISDAEVAANHERDRQTVAMQKKYEGIEKLINKISEESERFNAGIDSFVMRDIEYSLARAKRIVDGQSGNLKEANEILDEIERKIIDAQETKRLREVETQGQIKRMAEMLGSIKEITSENYQTFGLSGEQFGQIKNNWEIAGYCTEEIPSQKFADPKRAKELLDEIEVIIFTEPKTEEESFTNLLEKYGGKKKRKKTEEETLEKLVDEEKKIEFIEPEKMTEERRAELLAQLREAMIFMNSAPKKKVEPVKGKTEKDGEKKNKLVDRAKTIKVDWHKLKEEVEASDNFLSMRGKVAEMVKKAEKIAEETARLEGINEKWPERFRKLERYAVEKAVLMAQELDTELNHEQIKIVIDSIKAEIIKTAQSQGEIKSENIDEAVGKALEKVL